MIVREPARRSPSMRKPGTVLPPEAQRADRQLGQWQQVDALIVDRLQSQSHLDGCAWVRSW